MKLYTLLSATVIALTLQSTQVSWSAKLYKWVDEDGNISYQDSPPPEGSEVIKEEEIRKLAPTSTSQPTGSTIVFRQQPVTIYTVPNCPACETLLEQLRAWNIPVSEESLQDRSVQARILETTDSLSAPTLFIGDNIVANHSDENLKTELRNAGHPIQESEEETEEIDAEAETETEAES